CRFTVTGPVTVVPSIRNPPLPPVTDSGPVTRLLSIVTAPVAPVTVTGPAMVAPVNVISRLPVALTGPLICPSVTTSDAPDRTVTGPLMVAPARQVTPAETVSGPRRSPVMVVVHCGPGRPTAERGSVSAVTGELAAR